MYNVTYPMSLNQVHLLYQTSMSVPFRSRLRSNLRSNLESRLRANSTLTPNLFADDSNFFISGTNLKEMTNTINTEMEEILTWLKANKLSLNVKKTKIMLFNCPKNIKDTGHVQNCISLMLHWNKSII